MVLMAAVPAPPGRLVNVGGYRVHLYCTGAGAPTVMVVGGGFSVDWGMVQSEVARFATVCTYDISGTAWSDPGPTLTCEARVNEIHSLIHRAPLRTPLVLVGLSIGGCVVRLYAAEHPADVAGMVIVDHAFQPDRDPDPDDSNPRGADSGPVVIRQTPIAIDVEEISDFGRLPERLQRLHRWAASLHPRLPTWEDAADCLARLREAARGPEPLGDLPLVVVSTGNRARGYARLQSELMALSRRSTQMIAQKSFHSVEIDQPEVIVAAVRKAVGMARR